MICYNAATKGHLEIVKRALSKGWNMSHPTPGLEWQLCADVVSGAHIDVLKFGDSIGYNWCLHDVMFYAVREGHLDIAKWAFSEGCGLKDYHLELAQEERYVKTILWMLDIRKQNLDSCVDDGGED